MNALNVIQAIYVIQATLCLLIAILLVVQCWRKYGGFAWWMIVLVFCEALNVFFTIRFPALAIYTSPFFYALVLISALLWWISQVMKARKR